MKSDIELMIAAGWSPAIQEHTNTRFIALISKLIKLVEARSRERLREALVRADLDQRNAVLAEREACLQIVDYYTVADLHSSPAAYAIRARSQS